MTKKNLPILLLRNLILLPHNEIRLEIDNLLDKQLIALSEAYYNNELLVMIPSNRFEEEPEKDELPNVGVIAEIKTKIEMANGKIRVILAGIERAKVKNITKEDELYEGFVTSSPNEELEEKTSQAYLRVLLKELSKFEEATNYLDNKFMIELYATNDLGVLVEVVPLVLAIDFDRKNQYIEETSIEKRVKMIVEDLRTEVDIVNVERAIDAQLSDHLDKSQKDFILREKVRLIKEELGEGFNKEEEVDQTKLKIKSLKAPKRIKERLEEEIKRYETINVNSPELGMAKGYIDYMLALPWSKTTKDEANLKKVSDSLNETHYALNQVKERVIEYLAVKQNTNNLRSPIICLVGPPGVGKTSLAKSIAQALKRKSTKISVGGINDEADIIGHRRTYIGAAPGLIIQGIKKAGVINPVFIIDEIDKMTKGISGDPAAALLEVLDPEQNVHFVDHYIEEEYDLSQVMFVATANYLWQIPRALRDRLEIVELSSYTEFEKLDIAKRHLVIDLLKEHGLTKEEVIIEDDVIMDIIRSYTKESGVRELERNLATILRKVVKDKLINGKTKTYEITRTNLENYLNKRKFSYNDNDFTGSIGVVNGLAYTEFGGDILQIEATLYPGKGNLLLTGSLGEVMRESANLVYSYIKSNASTFKIKDEIINNHDIHIHVPFGAVPKDGPSAGVAITTTLISLLTKKSVSNLVAMTGEMTLRGKVLPIGGVKEKVIGAHRSGVKKIFLPKENERDLEEVPKELLKEIEFVFVKTFDDIYQQLFKRRRKTAKQLEYEKIQLEI